MAARAKKCEPGCTCGKHKKKGRPCQPGCECGRHTSKKPPCLPGCTCYRHRPRTEAEKQAISRAQIERYQRAREEAKAEVDRKRCNSCRRWKPVADFGTNKRTLATGEVKRYPRAFCRKCDAKRRREWKARMTPEQRREFNQRYYRRQKARDPEALRTYKREYSALRRRMEGVKPRGPWRKYRDRGRGQIVDARPFAEWLQQKVGTNGGITNLAQQIGVDESRLRTIINGVSSKNGKKYRVKGVTVELVDRSLIAVGGDTLLVDLYPALYE